MTAHRTERVFDIVLLDYGHGGQEPDGPYLTPWGKQFTFTTEKPPLFIGEGITNREQAWRLARMLLDLGVRVYDVVAGRFLTGRPTFKDLEQADVPLELRLERANAFDKESSFLLSLHGNAIGNDLKGSGQKVRGASFWTSVGQTRSDLVATSLHKAFSYAFSSLPVRVLRGQIDPDGDVDYEADFAMTAQTRMNAVLGEILFFTNLLDAKFLLSAHGQQVIARAYLDGLEPWLIYDALGECAA